MNLAETRSHKPLVNKPKVKKAAKPIRKIGKKMSALKREYMRLREAFLKEHPYCQYFQHFKETRHATEIHHKKGRGKFMLDTSTWMAVCRDAHEEIHFNPENSYKMGWMQPRR
jgi:hypothetical protein